MHDYFLGVTFFQFPFSFNLLSINRNSVDIIIIVLLYLYLYLYLFIGTKWDRLSTGNSTNFAVCHLQKCKAIKQYILQGLMEQGWQKEPPYIPVLNTKMYNITISKNISCIINEIFKFYAQIREFDNFLKLFCQYTKYSL